MYSGNSRLGQRRKACDASPVGLKRGTRKTETQGRQIYTSWFSRVIDGQFEMMQNIRGGDDARPMAGDNSS